MFSHMGGSRFPAGALGLLVNVGALAAFVVGCGPAPEGSPDELIAQGWSNYRMEEYDRAIECFESAAKKAPDGSDEHLHGLYGVAATWDMRRPGEDRQLAKTVYEQVVEAAPESDWAAWSLLALARQKHLAPVGEILDYAAIRDAYQRVIDRFPHHLAGEEAFVFQQGTLLASLDENDAQKVVTATTQFIESHPASPFLSQAYALLSSAYGTLGLGEEKLDAAIKGYETGEVDPTVFVDPQGVYWNTAVAAEFDAGDFKTAREFYQRFIDECPRDMKHYGAILALKRMDRVEAAIREELLAESSAAGNREGVNE